MNARRRSIRMGHAMLVALAVACTPGVDLRDSGSEFLDANGRDLPTGSDGNGGWDRLAPRDSAAGYDSAVVGTLVPGRTTLTLSVAGASRSVLLVVPNEVLSNQRPLVVALHGNGDDPTNFLSSIGLDSAAAARGVIIAAPQVIPQTFSYGGQTLTDIDWDAYRDESEANMDLPLLVAIRNYLINTSSVSLGKIYVFGYSQGGYLAFRDAMENSTSLAAAVVVSATNPLPGSTLIAEATRKIPIAMTIGTNDYAIGQARQTHTELLNAGFDVQYDEVVGAGHVPFPGDAAALLDWLLQHSLY